MKTRVVLGSAAAAASLFCLATPAGAHGAPFTVTAGSAPSGSTIAVTKATLGTITFRDVTTGVSLTCTSARTRGQLTVGQSSGDPLVTFDGASVVVSGCTGPAGLVFAVTGSGTWGVNVTDATGGVAAGALTNFRVHVRSTAGPACSFDIGRFSGSYASSATSTVPGGTLPGTYANSTQNLQLPASSGGSVALWNVKGSGTNTYCVSPSVVKQGDKASLSMTLKVTADNASYNPIAIS